MPCRQTSDQHQPIVRHQSLRRQACLLTRLPAPNPCPTPTPSLTASQGAVPGSQAPADRPASARRQRFVDRLQVKRQQASRLASQPDQCQAPGSSELCSRQTAPALLPLCFQFCQVCCSQPANRQGQARVRPASAGWLRQTPRQLSSYQIPNSSQLTSFHLLPTALPTAPLLTYFYFCQYLFLSPGSGPGRRQLALRRSSGPASGRLALSSGHQAPRRPSSGLGFAQVVFRRRRRQAPSSSSGLSLTLTRVVI